MEEKCPNCGEPLITNTIKKQLRLGSIEYPVVQICPRCNWSRDLTGAGDIPSKPVIASSEAKKEKPPAPEPAVAKPVPLPDVSRLVTVALGIIIIGGFIWVLFIYPYSLGKNVSPEPTPTPLQTVQTTTPVPEVTPTGKDIPVKLDRRRGFFPDTITIRVGDKIVWNNDDRDKETVTLVSSEDLFDAKLLPWLNRHNYIFREPGTYGFYLKENNLKGTIIVES